MIENNSAARLQRVRELTARLKGVSVPPSQDSSKRDAFWNMKFLVAQSYMWGRKDQGMQSDPNFDMAFCETYADAYWHFERHERVFMPCLSRALDIYLETGDL